MRECPGLLLEGGIGNDPVRDPQALHLLRIHTVRQEVELACARVEQYSSFAARSELTPGDRLERRHADQQCPAATGETERRGDSDAQSRVAPRARSDGDGVEISRPESMARTSPIVRSRMVQGPLKATLQTSFSHTRRPTSS